ncbi:cation transporter, partial [Nesterenkonia halotolerans]|uniref:cation transporter n=1 Tax=Nesterenkonia halotolerans TaxID=225325 RepID=UPI003EE44CE1
AVMPALSWFERRTGRELGSASTVADSKQTLLCSYLSGVLLVGLLLNSTLGWSWADPIAALIIAAVAVKEGLEAWRGDACCTPAHILTAADTGTDTSPGTGSNTEAVGAPVADETSDLPEDSPAPALA